MATTLRRRGPLAIRPPLERESVHAPVFDSGCALARQPAEKDGKFGEDQPGDRVGERDQRDAATLISIPTTQSGRNSDRSGAGTRSSSGFSPKFPGFRFRVCPVVTPTILCDHLCVSRTVLIVDDHAAFRASARTLLEDEGYEVIGEADSGASALDLARALRPAIVLLDVALPDLSGLEVAERLAETDSKIVLVSSRQPSDFGTRFRQSPAAGFISKDDLSGDSLQELLEAGR
jgi:CheY-like chemotaxis protein